MNVAPLGIAAAALACNIPAQRCPVDSGQLIAACRLAWEQGGQLVALWASDERDRERGFCVRVLLKDRDGLTLLEHTLPNAGGLYPDLADCASFAVTEKRTKAEIDGLVNGPLGQARLEELVNERVRLEEQYLEKEGYRVISACNGVEAVVAMKSAANALSRRAVSCPIRPRPSNPTVRPCSVSSSGAPCVWSRA